MGIEPTFGVWEGLPLRTKARSDNGVNAFSRISLWRFNHLFPHFFRSKILACAFHTFLGRLRTALWAVPLLTPVSCTISRQERPWPRRSAILSESTATLVRLLKQPLDDQTCASGLSVL